MSEIVIEKNFGSLFDPNEEFSDKNRKCFLWVRGKVKEGNIFKKKIRTNEKFTQKNIKFIEEAKYGYDDNNCIDVLDVFMEYKENYCISQNFTKNNDKFFHFCNTLLKVICPRCYNNYAHTKLNPHNHGYMNMKITEASNQTSIHIFHGIMKCFIAFVINDDKNIIKKKRERFIECFSDLIVNKNHSGLDHFTYANTIYNYFMKLNENKSEFIGLEKKMKFSTLITLKTIFKYQYPALKYLCENKGSIFLRHGLEKKTDDYSREMIYPHNDDRHGWRIHNVTMKHGESAPTIFPSYPIEVDTLPFKKCASHSSKEIYGNVKGYIAFPNFKKLGGNIHMRYEKEDKVMPRDHLFAESNIHVKHWIFTYRKNYDPSVKENIKKAVHAIVQEGLPIIDEAIILNFTHVLEAITNKFILLH
jgi:hypothetical protein